MENIRTLKNSMGKGIHKVFKNFENELNNSVPTLVESESELSHFIPEPRNFQKSPGYEQM